TLTLDLAQRTAPTPGQPHKAPVPIPVRLGVLDEDGRSQTFAVDGGAPTQEAVVVLDGDRSTVRLAGVTRAPVLSLLRGLSAPVARTCEEPAAHRYVRLASDPDLFNRWDAGQALARDLILARAAGRPDAEGEARYARAVGRALADQAAEPALRALLLVPPSEIELAQAMTPVDPAALHEAREALRRAVATELAGELTRLHDGLADAGPFSPDAEAAGRRALRNAALELLAVADAPDATARAEAHYREARDMTAALGGLTALMQLGGPAFEAALGDFAERWKA